ncbi:alkyl hydroperoxide reductase AhpD [Rhodococcoides trifolii]|uniref:Alkyl hydroperoxide reductase AhpD n=1 Tax=Rhodococcoides trifolii TaxID=908250 RepID=A0A917CRK8_9NOCA|nr:carboxymuconolactone decarboxylase family protein [Rhodococcus trifolii]GGF96197.1 alkyl hydroperoxide reductase AhpD [Rhodococcus trifolii]
MTTRVFLDKAAPTAYKHLGAVALDVKNQAEHAGLGRIVMELVNVRVSQMNRCVFCLDLHTRAARNAGETDRRLAVLPAWRDATIFSDEERAALEIAEAVTSVAGEHLSDEQYDRLRHVLGEEKLTVLIWAAITINAFNRVSVLSKHPLPKEK